jgi:hypothetical protein
MKLKSYKTIQMLYVVVSALALITACHTKVTEPLKSMSGQGVVISQTVVSYKRRTSYLEKMLMSQLKISHFEALHGLPSHTL